MSTTEFFKSCVHFNLHINSHFIVSPPLNLRKFDVVKMHVNVWYALIDQILFADPFYQGK